MFESDAARRAATLDRVFQEYEGPAFYKPWLGKSLAYSCAYFRDPTDSLDRAQQQKLELICRKLRFQPGERFLDIGCGWGSLVLEAARRDRGQTRLPLTREYLYGGTELRQEIAL